MILLRKMYHFFSSVKLAIPVMISLLICSVIGTIIESRYNAEYAGLVIYKSWWFLLILLLLGVNITLATVTRLPWKKRHLGFLVTHLGMITLLVGSVLTMKFGLDGTMQIVEGGESNLVFLQNNVVEINHRKVEIPRYLEKTDLLNNSKLNDSEFKFTTFLPFVEIPEKTFERGINLNFKIKSAFFDVVQVLNTEMQKEVQMGPATFRIVDGNSKVVTPSQIKTPKMSNSKKGLKLIVKDNKNGPIAELDIQNKKTVGFKDLTIDIVKIYSNAQIVNNKIGEGDSSKSNPAVELQITKAGKSMREILYQHIPEFSLNSNGIFEFHFSLSGSETIEQTEINPSLPQNHPQINGAIKGISNTSRIGNTVEFKILDRDKNIVEVALYKAGEQLLKKILNKDEMMITPWMGIEVTFKGITSSTDPIVPIVTEPQYKMPLPPSAILMNVGSGVEKEERWISENSEIQMEKSGQATLIYYGKERLELPFSLSLEKFEKRDYPGSEMAMNYKSYVKINGKGNLVEIFMNEPLKFEGYTFYQSSYQMTPNEPAITILSVNRDPGRIFKYFGSLILCLGIILYTFQKSKRFKKYLN